VTTSIYLRMTRTGTKATAIRYNSAATSIYVAGISGPSSGSTYGSMHIINSNTGAITDKIGLNAISSSTPTLTRVSYVTSGGNNYLWSCGENDS
jgi:hypothetical protein